MEHYQEILEKEFTDESIEAFMNSHIGYVKEHLEKHPEEEFLSMLILRSFDPKTEKMGEVVVMLADIPKDGKDLYFRNVGAKMAEQFIVASALFISEVWMLAVDPDVEPAFRASEHPASIEGFGFCAQPLKGNGSNKMFKLVRDAQGNITMGDLHMEGKGENAKHFLLDNFFYGYLEGIKKRL